MHVVPQELRGYMVWPKGQTHTHMHMHMLMHTDTQAFRHTDIRSKVQCCKTPSPMEWVRHIQTSCQAVQLLPCEARAPRGMELPNRKAEAPFSKPATKTHIQTSQIQPGSHFQTFQDGIQNLEKLSSCQWFSLAEKGGQVRDARVARSSEGPPG